MGVGVDGVGGYDYRGCYVIGDNFLSFTMSPFTMYDVLLYDVNRLYRLKVAVFICCCDARVQAILASPD